MAEGYARSILGLSKGRFELGARVAVRTRLLSLLLLLLRPQGFPLGLADANGGSKLRNLLVVLSRTRVAIESLFMPGSHGWRVMGLAERSGGFRFDLVEARAWQICSSLLLGPELLSLRVPEDDLPRRCLRDCLVDSVVGRSWLVLTELSLEQLVAHVTALHCFAESVRLVAVSARPGHVGPGLLSP